MILRLRRRIRCSVDRTARIADRYRAGIAVPTDVLAHELADLRQRQIRRAHVQDAVGHVARRAYEILAGNGFQSAVDLDIDLVKTRADHSCKGAGSRDRQCQCKSKRNPQTAFHCSIPFVQRTIRFAFFTASQQTVRSPRSGLRYLRYRRRSGPYHR